MKLTTPEEIEIKLAEMARERGAGSAEYWGLPELLQKCKELIESHQAQIDALMLEYCPDEMTEEQMDNWTKHQSPSTLKDI